MFKVLRLVIHSFKVTAPLIIPLFLSFYLLVKKLMVTNNAFVKIQNLIMNHESQLVKSYPAKNWSNMWQALVIGCWAQLKAMGDDHICKKSQGRDEPTCSQGSFNWFSALLS